MFPMDFSQPLISYDKNTRAGMILGDLGFLWWQILAQEIPYDLAKPSLDGMLFEDACTSLSLPVSFIEDQACTEVW